MRATRSISLLTAAALLMSSSAGHAIDLGSLAGRLKDALPIAGGLLGGAACRKLFEGKNQDMATVICAATGAWLGATLRKHLSEREQAQLAEQTYKSLESGRQETSTSERGTTITTQVVGSSRAASGSAAARSPEGTAPFAPAASSVAGAASAVEAQSRSNQSAQTAPAQPEVTVTMTADQGECRTVRQTIVLKNGDRYQEDVTACKKDGKWAPFRKS